MRHVLGLVLVVAFVTPAFAQDDSTHPHRVVKTIIGGAAIAIGTAVAAASSETTTTTSVLGTAETSSFSKSQLITGLSLAGVGGIVLWDGLREHDRSRPHTTLAVAVGKRAGQLVLRRTW